MKVNFDLLDCVAFLQLVTTGTSVLGDSDNQAYLITHKYQVKSGSIVSRITEIL